MQYNLVNIAVNEDLNIPALCALERSYVVPHPKKCQLYYNCSQIYEFVPSFFEPYMMECKYPNLFSETTKTCRHFREVTCGGREEIKDACTFQNLYWLYSKMFAQKVFLSVYFIYSPSPKALVFIILYYYWK